MIIAILLIAVWVGLMIGIPLSLIWALNTLFACSIRYWFDTWLAAFILIALFTNAVTSNIKNTTS